MLATPRWDHDSQVAVPKLVSCAALAVTMATVPVACGGTESESAQTEPTVLRAHFKERTTFGDGTEWTRRGAFDWEVMRGFFSQQALRESEVEETRDVIQIDSRCYEREDDGRWRVSSPEEYDNTLCDPQFLSPTRDVKLIRSTSSEWTETDRSTDVQGVDTTRYVTDVHVGAIHERVELWIDDMGLPRKIIRGDKSGNSQGRYRVVREYFDFGHSVEVSAPS